MSDKGIVRLASTDDVSGIVSLIEEGFTAHERSLFIYGCGGADKYIKDLISSQISGSDSTFLIVKEAKVLAFVEIRRIRNSICLNYMATCEKARGRGLYRLLMAEAVAVGRDEGFQIVSYDVFVRNTIRKFLGRMGYRITTSLTWLVTDLPYGPFPKRVYFSGLPQADAVQNRFGFSQFSVMTPTARYDIGRLGDKWFRTTNPALLGDRFALLALGNLARERRLLCIVPKSTPVPDDMTFEMVLASDRFEGDIDVVLSALQGAKAHS
jgi:GNAT superfamily N-acetyltransferase